MTAKHCDSLAVGHPLLLWVWYMGIYNGSQLCIKISSKTSSVNVIDCALVQSALSISKHKVRGLEINKTERGLVEEIQCAQ